jgi:transcriptional regulator of acetoin/glycerol metabolism
VEADELRSPLSSSLRQNGYLVLEAHDVPSKIPSETMRALESWSWPGNARELENFKVDPFVKTILRLQ